MRYNNTCDLFSDNDTHGILQIDARNAFNSTNSKGVHNMKILCPELSNFINNCYTNLPNCSSSSAIKVTQLPCRCTRSRFYPISQDSSTAKKMAFADDFTGIRTIEQLKTWWDTFNNHGPYIGYHPNASKSHRKRRFHATSRDTVC